MVKSILFWFTVKENQRRDIHNRRGYIAGEHYQVPPEAQKRIFHGGQWNVKEGIPTKEKQMD